MTCLTTSSSFVYDTVLTGSQASICSGDVISRANDSTISPMFGSQGSQSYGASDTEYACSAWLCAPIAYPAALGNLTRSGVIDLKETYLVMVQPGMDLVAQKLYG